MWIYHADATRAILFGDFGLSGAINFNIELTTSHTLRFYWNGSPDVAPGAAVISQSTWAHAAYVYNGSSLKFYVNGELKYTWSGTLAAKTKSSGSYYLGRDSRTGATVLNGRLNDFRLYDHALSVKEVRELSKALVLHYKLDDPYVEGTTNYLTAAGSCANWRNYTASTWATSIDSTCAIGNYVITYSAYIKNNTNVSVRVRCSPLYVAGSYGTIYGNWIAPGGQGWSSVTCDISNSDTYTGSFYPYVATSIAGTIPDMPNFQVLHAQAERKDHRTAWTLGGTTRAAATLVYDSSGYKYNGTPTNVETSTPSVRYSMCSSFNGTDSRIVVPYNAACPTNIFTLNLWWKKDALGSKGYETLFGGPSGFEMDTRAGSATTLCLYMASTRGGTLYSPLSLGQWYMFTLVRDGTNEFYYINGALVKTIEAKSMPTGTYFIGAWSSATSQNYYGKIADFRLYNTPLSAADVLDLYRTEAVVDRNSAVHAREVVEV